MQLVILPLRRCCNFDVTIPTLINAVIATFGAYYYLNLLGWKEVTSLKSRFRDFTGVTAVTSNAERFDFDLNDYVSKNLTKNKGLMPDTKIGMQCYRSWYDGNVTINNSHVRTNRRKAPVLRLKE